MTTGNWKKFLPAAIALLLTLMACVRAPAMPPPTEEELEMYRLDGTLQERIEYSKQFENTQMREDLVARANYRLKKMLGIPVPEGAPPPAWKGMPTTGTVKIFVLCIAFADYPPYNTIENIDNDIFGDGDAEDYPYESLRNYYLRSSYNQLDIQGNVLGWYTTPYDREDYEGERALIKEAVLHFDQQGHDFTQYDNDGDGVVDYFMVIWTGPHTGWASRWWAHMTMFMEPQFFVDGLTLDTYSWNWESKYSTWYGSPGEYEQHVTIHETGHGLGLPDLYDYSPELGPPNGVGDLDMMDANWGDHNAFSKFVLEWLTPRVYVSGTHTGITLDAVETGEDAVIIMPDIEEGESFNEYFMLENRNQTLNDITHPGKGMLIWHVDARLGDSGSSYAYDNSYTAHKLVRLMEADGKEEIEMGYDADADDYYESGHEFGPATTPNNYRYSGAQSGFNIYGISAAGESMTFSVTFDSTPPSSPGWIYDGPTYGTDDDFSYSGSTLSANWQPATDTESGIMSYMLAIGTTPGATDTMDWKDTGTATGAEVSIYFSNAFASGTTYYFTVKAVNGAAMESGTVSSDGVTVGYTDDTPPFSVYYVEDGLSLDIDYTPYDDRLSANWYEAYDYDSGILRYLYGIGTTEGATDVVDWTDNGLSLSVTVEDMDLDEGATYYFTVVAENMAGLKSDAANSDGQMVDTTPPADPTFVYDGPEYGVDIDETSYIYKIYANWGAASDAQSGITGYNYAIGTATDPTNVTGWYWADTATSITRTEVALIDGTTYYFSVKAISGAGVETGAVQSDGQIFRMDKTPPDPPSFVYDGTGADVDIVDSNYELSANWNATSDPDSGIERYLYAIGSTPGATDVVNWVSADSATGVTATGFEKLTDQQTYYFAVKAENLAGLASAAAVSDGQMVDVFDFESVTQVDATTIDVKYSRDVSSSTTAADTSSYSVSLGVGEPESAVLQADAQTVRLTTSSQLAECFQYELYASGIDDGNGKDLMPGASPEDVEMLGIFYYGDVKADQTWEAADNPHCLMGDLGIYNDFSVHVEAGSVIKFNPNPDPDTDNSGEGEISVYGELVMNGTADNPITVTSAATSPVAGDWGGITFFADSSMNNKVTYTNFDYGRFSIHISGSSPEISHNSFSQCELECLKIDNGAPKVLYNTFTDCGDDYYCLKTSSDYDLLIKGNSVADSHRGILLLSPAVLIGNDLDGMADVALGVSIGADDAYIKENNFRNSAYGLYSWNEGGNTDAHLNYFYGNTTDTATECSVHYCYVNNSFGMSNPADETFAPSSLSLYRNSSYSEEMGASTVPDSTIYIQLSGTGLDLSSVNTTLVKVTSETTDADGIYVQLMEKSTSASVYRGSVTTAGASDQSFALIGVGLGEEITVTSVRDDSLYVSVTIDNDTTAPTAPAEVIDGLGQDIATSTVNTGLAARWSEASDTESGIARYWYAVGTSPGATDTIDWTDNGATRFINLSGLNLKWGFTYYTSVKAENGAGLLCDAVSSNGQTIVYSGTPSGPTIYAGWNFIGVSLQNVTFQTDLFFASGTFEIYSYDGSTYNCTTDQSTQDLAMGSGYWVYSKSDLGMLEPGGSAASGVTYSVSLSTGWNAFSLPFTSETEWGDSLAGMDCGEGGADLPSLFYYTGSTYVEVQPNAGTLLYPWQGYWTYTSTACQLVITMQ